MHTCTRHALPKERHENTFQKARDLLSQWQVERTTGRRYLIAQCFRPAQRVYEDFVDHWEDELPEHKRAQRYRWLPCVMELLTQGPQSPFKDASGACFVYGRVKTEGKAAPDLHFRVVLRKSGNEWFVKTFHWQNYAVVKKVTGEKNAMRC